MRNFETVKENPIRIMFCDKQQKNIFSKYNKHQEKINYNKDEYNYLSEFESLNINIPNEFNKNKKVYNIYYEKML